MTHYYNSSTLLAGSEYDYCDTFSKEFSDVHNRIKINDLLLYRNAPLWISLLMNLRDGIVSLFGLKTSPKYEKGNTQEITLKRDLQLGIFKVIDFNDHEIIMGENDKHLNFKLSILLQDHLNGQKQVLLTTLVKYNNLFGRIYFFVVKPFHRIIVPVMIRSMLKNLQK